MTTPDLPLKGAMVGLRIHAGSIHPDKGDGLLKSFLGQEAVKVVAYCEWAPDQAAALDEIRQDAGDARIYTDLDDLIENEELDFAAIMLPPNEATPTAIRLAENGVHLFIEKQAARTAEDLKPLREIVHRNGVVTQVGYPWPYHPVAIELKRLIDAGVLGRLLDIEARLVTVAVRPGLRDPEHWMYRHETEGGGILHMEGGHWLTLFRFFSQAEVKSVTALCGRVDRTIEAGLEDVATVALEFNNGVHACLHMGYLLPGVGSRNDTYFGLRGTLGTATWEPTGDAEFAVASIAPDWQSAPERQFRMEIKKRSVYADQWGFDFVAAFIRSIRHGTPSSVSIDDAHRIMQIIDACYESSRSGRRIELDSSY
jgi:predicted dehydrogenase